MLCLPRSSAQHVRVRPTIVSGGTLTVDADFGVVERPAIEAQLRDGAGHSCDVALRTVRFAASDCRLGTRGITVTTVRTGASLTVRSVFGVVPPRSRWNVSASVTSPRAGEALEGRVTASKAGVAKLRAVFEYAPNRSVSVNFSDVHYNQCRLSFDTHRLPA